jgi:phospholipase C
MIGSNGVDAQYDALGLRIPMFVISPYAKRGYVSHVTTDHTSILRFVEALYHLPALTHRDANAVPPFDMFDFDHPDVSVPTLPTPTVDQAKLSACMTQYPH